MAVKKKAMKKRCWKRKEIPERIWFTALMTEERTWNREGYNECTAMHSLTTDPQSNVECSRCDAVVGTGYDFGFGENLK